MNPTLDRPKTHPDTHPELLEFDVRREATPWREERRRTPRGAWAALLASAAMIAGGAVAIGQLDDGPATPVAASTTPGSLSALAAQLDVPVIWGSGFTGAGVNVAMVDTGVAPVEAIADQVVVAVDLTDEAGDAATAGIDTYGHGTHLAGIVAADDPANGISGLAPDAGIVSVKVAGRDGSVLPLDLINGIDWVVAHADQYDISVLSLAFNAPTTDAATEQMLLDAVERAWDAGIVVVTAAGNDGGVGLTAPASSRSSIAVASVEATDAGFEVADFSSLGDGLRNPDVAVPGKSIESLRVPGSYADTEHPEGYVDDVRFKGTGTSQSAAAVAALSALMLEANPELTNDQVRDALVSSATPVGTPEQTGAGVPSALVAVDLVSDGVSWTGQAWSGQAWSGQAWSGQAWSGQAWSGQAWSGQAWSGQAWSGQAWSGQAWSGQAWSGQAWSGQAWSGQAWSGQAWSGQAWSGQAWSGQAWSGQAWSGQAWSGQAWSGQAWSGQAWSGQAWSGQAWSGQAWSGQAWSGQAWSGQAWSGQAWSGQAWSGQAWS